MAEALEINFPTESEKNPTLDPEIKSQILDYNIKESDDNKQEECPDELKIDNYYGKDDELGKNVLQQKYLAPWEKHPWDLWKRQAKALASVEKTKSLQEKWEAKFFEVILFFQHLLVLLLDVSRGPMDVFPMEQDIFAVRHFSLVRLLYSNYLF
jgi:ribonucleoside-diphosphate reductase alpha chain